MPHRDYSAIATPWSMYDGYKAAFTYPNSFVPQFSVFETFCGNFLYIFKYLYSIPEVKPVFDQVCRKFGCVPLKILEVIHYAIIVYLFNRTVNKEKRRLTFGPVFL